MLSISVIAEIIEQGKQLALGSKAKKKIKILEVLVNFNMDCLLNWD